MLDPGTMEAAAATYDQGADEVAMLGRRAATLVDGSSWTCCAADRCRDDAWQASGTADVVSSQLRGIAADLRGLAAIRRAQIASAEAQVRSYLASQLTGAASPLGYVAVTLPPSGDVAWILVARELGLGY